MTPRRKQVTPSQTPRDKDGRFPIAQNQGKCKWCANPFTERRQYEPKFCDDDCAAAYRRNTGKQGKAGYPKGRPNDPKHVALGKQLAFDNLYDPIRDTIRDEVRLTITQRVKDNVLGMTELLSDLLPIVLAGIARDVQSEDVFVRQKAQALVLKYVMPLQNEEPKTDDSRVINVIHQVAIPDTKLGYDVESELVMLPPGVEAFEADWPVCEDCRERKSPETGAYKNTGTSNDRSFLCNACNYRERIRTGKTGGLNPANESVNLTGQ